VRLESLRCGPRKFRKWVRRLNFRRAVNQQPAARYLGWPVRRSPSPASRASGAARGPCPFLASISSKRNPALKNRAGIRLRGSRTSSNGKPRLLLAILAPPEPLAVVPIARTPLRLSHLGAFLYETDAPCPCQGQQAPLFRSDLRTFASSHRVGRLRHPRSPMAIGSLNAISTIACRSVLPSWHKSRPLPVPHPPIAFGRHTRTVVARKYRLKSAC